MFFSNPDLFLRKSLTQRWIFIPQNSNLAVNKQIQTTQKKAGDFSFNLDLCFKEGQVAFLKDVVW